MIGALGESFLQNAFFAGALYEISDFKIVFVFKNFFCHFFSSLPQFKRMVWSTFFVVSMSFSGMVPNAFTKVAEMTSSAEVLASTPFCVK